MIPGDLNQELFDQVWVKEKLTAKKNSVLRLKKQLQNSLKLTATISSCWMFVTYQKKVGKLEFADELMKRIMLENNKEKGEEFVSEHYERAWKN